MPFRGRILTAATEPPLTPVGIRPSPRRVRRWIACSCWSGEVSPGREATCRAVFGTWGSFPDDARAGHCPFVLTSFTGWSSERRPGIGFLPRGDREIGVLRNVEAPTRPRLECRREPGLILRCDRKFGTPSRQSRGVDRPVGLFDHFQFALIHGPDIPGSHAILLFTASDLASITSHIHSWVLFLLWLPPFILSGVISPLISSSILGTY